MELVQHVPDETLELFAMQRLPDSETGQMDLHRLVCGECRVRLDTEIEFVAAMREAAVKIRCDGIS